MTTGTPPHQPHGRDEARATERSRDALTGLGLRGELADRGPELLRDAAARGARPLLLAVDLDSFKHLNDSAGHHVGDQVLLQCAERLRRALEPDDLLVRLGGDEFAVLTAPRTDFLSPAALAERVLGCFDAHFAVDELQLSVQASVGIATFPEDGTTVAELSLAADQAMYEAKESGTARWRAASSDAAWPAGWTARVVDDLRDPRSSEQMTVHYQPQVDSRTGQVCGFDALVRWDHPEYGLIPASAFVPLAARSGLLGPITATVMGEALDAVPLLQRHAPGSRVSISVTRRHLLGEGLVDQLVGAVRDRGLDPTDLLLKISEPLTRSRSTPQPVFEQLASHDLGVTIRGYGRAWSSLTALWLNPAVREVKIAPDLARAVTTDPQVHRLVRALTHGARELGLRVAAEGVERTETAQTLGELGCDVTQGFWVCPAVPLDEAVAWSRRRLETPLAPTDPTDPIG